MKHPVRMLIVSLALIFVGGLLAMLVQTDFGKVKIKDLRFMGSNGTEMSALLYIPQGVTAKTPAPGILAIHGYINSRETQDGFAIEFARRGYVVLAADQTGHGYSDPPAFANGYGGPDALAYLRSLDIVDKNNVGLEGHSMGGWAVGIAAGVFPNDYKSLVLEGSSTGTLGAPDGTPTFPRNFALVYSKWDEFSQLMWLTPVPGNIGQGQKLQTVFGTTSPVVPGKLYGSIADGTAREWFQPVTTHPGDHLSTVAIGYAISWFQQTLTGGNGLPPSNQIWYWKEIGTLIALIGMIMLLFPVGQLLLQTHYFSELVEASAPSKGAAGVGWWVAAFLFVSIAPLLFFPFINIPADLKWTVTRVFPQDINNTIIAWTTLIGVIDVALFLLWHFALNRKAKANGDHYGLTWGAKLNWRKIGKSFLLAFLVAFAAYATLMFSDYFFKTDFRFWVFAVKLLSPLQLQITLSYIIPFIFIFFMDALLVFGELRRPNLSLAKEMWLNWVLYVLGYVALLLAEYIPLLAGGTLLNVNFPNVPLYSIVAFQLVPIMTIAALVTTFFNRKTGHVYAGAFLTAMLVTWIVVASTAIQFAF
ncbi:MAG TPA: alpha/beta fold hydrolase [Anaerolineales bacterium]|nr:alpha/beta fold hydrolase [Anaerolineales bacterium]